MRLTATLWHDMLGIAMLLILDQVSKYIVPQWQMTYTLNQGSVAGLGRELSIPWWWWAIPSLMVLTLLWRPGKFFIPTKSFYSARILISSGIVGNLIDRFSYGAVLDFIDISIAGFHWPAFNFADIYLVMGVLLVLVTLVSRKHV